MNITLLQIVIEANGVALGGFGNSAHAQQWLGKKAAAAALALFFLPLQVKEGPGPSAHCSIRGKSRFTHGQGGGWAQEPAASERLPGARAELAAGQQQQAPTGGVAQGKWQRAHAAPQRR